MKRVLIGALVGGVVLFVWQWCAWTFGIHKLDQEPVLKNETAVVDALKGNKRGVYWIPGIEQDKHGDTESEEHKEWKKKHEAGPRAWVVYDPDGRTPMAPAVMAKGGVVALLIGLVVAFLLSRAHIRGYGGRVLFVGLLGVFVALVMDIQGAVWMNHPTDWTRGWVIDHVGGFVLLGVVMGLIVKPE